MFIESKSEVDFLIKASSLTAANQGPDGMWLLAPVFTCIPYSPSSIETLLLIDQELKIAIPELHRFSNRRAKKAFASNKGTLTKPSYISRLTSCTSDWGVQQTESLTEIFKAEPTSGGLVFSIFHPKDIQARYRPGYTPCIVAGSFLLLNSKLHLNVFFRSQSILEFGIHDLIFLRSFQRDMLHQFKVAQPRRKLEPGHLNLSFGRLIIQRRIARRRIKKGFKYQHIHLDRSHVFMSWHRVVSRHAHNTTAK